MKYGAGLGLVGAVWAVSLGGGVPLDGPKTVTAGVEPYGQTSFVNVHDGRKRASAIVIGDGSTYLGVYVFDRWGNCVARDDFAGSPAGRDDLAVEWYPPEVGPYAVDVCNFGRSGNDFTIVIR
jgi:hypothetical protein